MRDKFRSDTKLPEIAMQLTRIANDELTVDVAALGAEMQSLQTRDGRNWMWQGDANFWTGRSPILFPIVGKAINDSLQINGERFQMGQHGFARRCAFELVLEEASRCIYRLSASDATLQMYPFDFQLDIEHRLVGRSVIVTATVANLGDKPMPFGVGFHPAFAWPLPGANGAHKIRLENQNAPGMKRLSGGVFNEEVLPSPFVNGELTLDHSQFVDDAMVFMEGAGESLVYGPDDGPSLRFSWTNLPNFALWTKPGAGFICLEPWHGTAAAQGMSDELADRPYTYWLEAGDSASFAFEAEVRG
ncbi:aldose 1-epimerase family protein [Devosia sp. WQ 349K1]|uniref:aldose 1-epimerase family protein n=1 Tax=Devosia sp. WQ 349K1 TaxID=2800329 RepID=UPI0020B1A1D0|nr:aldose 1-epimerase family protein [Devosia sp. WQ 349K1]